MDFGQTIRQIGRTARAWLSGARARLNAPPRISMPRIERPRLGSLARPVGYLVLAIAVAWPLLAWWTHVVDADPRFGPSENALKPGESRAVAAAIALLDREVNEHGWVANNPFFMPSALLDNMPNFQKGVVAALARFAFELTDQIGRTRGSSQADSDLQSAAGLLQYKPDVWVWDPAVSIWPTATSDQQYRAAMKALERYNTRLAAGAAVFDHRADNLQATLDRIALDLGSASAVVDTHLREQSGFPIHNDADDVFYMVKGQMYGYYIVLKGLERDFDAVIKERELGKPWRQMMESFEQGVGLSPWVVLNGVPDSQFVPCPLCAEGFYLLRARTQIREVTSILQK